MQQIINAFRYLNYFLNAVDEHSLHSPYIYDLYSRIIKPDHDGKEYEEYRKIRTELRADRRILKITDLGAGSVVNNYPVKTVSQIVRQSVTSSKQSRLFNRLIRFFNHEHIIELGSSVGINTLYLASAHQKAKVYTLEGCPQTAGIAREVFGRFKELSISLLQGNIDRILPNLVSKLPSIDFVYFDANHTYSATMNYFQQCLPKLHEKSVLVFDDIHWSKDMERAWEEIRNHKKITLTIDLFDSGLVFFKPLYVKQEYILSY